MKLAMRYLNRSECLLLTLQPCVFTFTVATFEPINEALHP